MKHFLEEVTPEPIKGYRGVSQAKLEWKNERGARALQAESTAPAKAWSVLCSRRGFYTEHRDLQNAVFWRGTVEYHVRRGEQGHDCGES